MNPDLDNAPLLLDGDWSGVLIMLVVWAIAHVVIQRVRRMRDDEETD